VVVRAERFRLIVVVLKLFTGSLELVFGVGLLAFSVASLHGLVDSLARHHRWEDPDDAVLLLIQHRLPALLSNKSLIAASLIALGTVKVVGALGLLNHRPWGLYLLLGLLAVLLPADVVHLVRNPSVPASLLVGLNGGVLAVLVLYRQRLIASDEG
jgi:uncharacterized membrane protein (DUF2068 family)